MDEAVKIQIGFFLLFEKFPFKFQVTVGDFPQQE